MKRVSLQKKIDSQQNQLTKQNIIDRLIHLIDITNLLILLVNKAKELVDGNNFYILLVDKLKEIVNKCKVLVD